MMPDTMTAREMALRSHNLDRVGNLAFTPEGAIYQWIGSATEGRWIRRPHGVKGCYVAGCKECPAVLAAAKAAR